ncbi:MULTISPECIES: plasmid mobilization protein [Vibrio harveyi group]|uniref:plasmid mobilization protein n=1 Tax=Vibrio harveyi group TaxID=717610 RepID=UPI0006B25C6B|nr:MULTISPECIES: plasmid mobilization relaxosome protein MobC [Vibrio harveyi group]EJT4224696.1 plasmid mobilization relaxosome protein MobC [Vibrio parahaemolyticus]KOY43838.1 mobilization protein [Vibrio parahaemolyticus]MCG6438440.1 plasmid mobilization relaxosome protein MobC [Vibrio parahaemolyticus]MCS0112599.1 plasmid mobilization relaxosome protein MobC [Vibrio parahaemolyticus]MCS0360703.1 plasmid mobilization relaxosome protein MobC [Vibrio diabolicus]
MAQTKAQLTEQEKAAWKQFCDDNGTTESKMIRMMIGKVAPGVLESETDFQKQPKTNQVNIRLSTSDQQKLTKKAQLEGYPNRTKWTTAVVLRALHQEPVLSESEIAALRESNRELAAIGRNLNQIARTLNIEFREGDRLKLEAVEALTARIEQHKDSVATLINKNMNRWNDE